MHNEAGLTAGAGVGVVGCWRAAFQLLNQAETSRCLARAPVQKERKTETEKEKTNKQQRQTKNPVDFLAASPRTTCRLEQTALVLSTLSSRGLEF